MAVVIHLQGLRITAGSDDVRDFFTGLKIPDGGVHIIGGEREEAFIIFASDEDARRAMTRSEGSIKGSPVRLRLSSKSEMQAVLKQSIKPEVTKKRPYKEGFRRPEREGRNEEPGRKELVKMGSRSVSYSNVRSQARKPSSKPSRQDALYLLMQGMPFTTTEENVRDFFHGLLVEDIIMMRNDRGQPNVKGIVKFGSRLDAREGLKRNRDYFGTMFAELDACSEEQWFKAGGGREPGKDSSGTFRRGPSSAHSERSPGRASGRDSSGKFRRGPSSAHTERSPPGRAPGRDSSGTFRRGPSSAHTERSTPGRAPGRDSSGKFRRGPSSAHTERSTPGRAPGRDSSGKFRRGPSSAHTERSTPDRAPGRDSGGKFRRGPSSAHTERSPPGRARSFSPVAYGSTKSSSPPNDEFCVLVENLPYLVEKKDIREIFQHADLKYDQILHLLDKYGSETRSVFVLFNSLRDYGAALTLHKKTFFKRCVYISPISKEKMVAMLESGGNPVDGTPPSKRSYSRSQERLPRETEKDVYESEKICLYVRNLPFDVRKVEIVDFFLGFRISEEAVVLLLDHRGNGLGEALVIFKTEEEAMRAQSLNGQGFLGTNLILKCISLAQMHEFGVGEPAVKEQKMERSSERYLARNSEAMSHLYTDYTDYRVNPDIGHLPMNDLQAHIPGGSGLRLDYQMMESPVLLDNWGNGSAHRHGGYGPSAPQQFDGPTCLKLVNLPSTIRIDEIYDFCYGYSVIPGSVSLQYDNKGIPKGSATVVFGSRLEALTAVEELSERPIGNKKVKLVFV
ncbi:RNA-binding protein 12B-A-like [Salvelinus fontinalis]|nr:RNA binding motif protein 12Bb isoform X2 [Salvelinus fontinalis]XP_055758970.1 RNA binding motif protein 12Bb isoform X2 [Salvelinus fontinalis]XP_055769163.1 RNA-binding protein 12B-A-like [Salvelinus fontinalis]XP_055769164.1 RNA-binding protein 12B-A-like [Salvelinus fontinalis]XP_055769167.1 RNA-binding protein 12B-A-like [Salvelinus fontinalis]XP_055769168.1 RNA-binding protein 12B-A-like [Salvelinus fontinalis]